VPIPDKVQTRTGAYIYLDPNDTRGHRLIETHGDLNPPSLKAWQLLLAEHDWTLVVDVGANYGEMLVNGGVPTTARVIAVEPNATIRERLGRTLSEAGVEAELIGAALSDVPGEGRLLLTPPYSGTTRLAQANEGSDVLVEVTTLGAVLKRVGTPMSEMNVVVKIDVEGHEAAVLRGVLPELPQFGRFAALVEILHASPEDLTWIEERFDLRLLELGDGGLVPVAPGALEDMLKSGRFYPQDVVLMPKSDLPAT
jgi:FkbM family methyltransferase